MLRGNERAFRPSGCHEQWMTDVKDIAKENREKLWRKLDSSTGPLAKNRRMAPEWSKIRIRSKGGGTGWEIKLRERFSCNFP